METVAGPQSSEKDEGSLRPLRPLHRAAPTHALKLAAFAGGLIPLGRATYLILAADLGADPVRRLELLTGLSTLVMLLVTLSITPVRRLTGWNDLIKIRRMLGLFAFFYACIHASMYFVFDHSLDPAEITKDVVKHPWVTAGFSAFVLLIPLAITSTKASVRRLGGKRWQALHRLVYVAAVLGALHFLWLVKKDVREPVIYAGVLLALLAARLSWRSGLAKGRSRVAAQAGDAPMP